MDNTDAGALLAALEGLPAGPVLLLGDGGVALTTAQVLAGRGLPVLSVSRRAPASPEAVSHFAPVGVVQATGLGMTAGDPLPFPQVLEEKQKQMLSYQESKLHLDVLALLQLHQH